MAQGKYKKSKLQVPGKTKDKKSKKQTVVLRKGNFHIAPKKQKLIEAAKLKRGLEKGIQACIEDELTAKTVSFEPRSLAMLKPSASKEKKKK
uniref:Leydig cell tumor 10 kDa protein homolog n=1 Tax=Arion vulgaris TaxID=1028688 RepID=A0A0B6Y9S8_9EUPU